MFHHVLFLYDVILLYVFINVVNFTLTLWISSLMFYMTHTNFLISFGMTVVMLSELNNQFVIASYK